MIPSLYKIFQHWSAKGSVWLYSDPHFNDAEMNWARTITAEEQIKNINSKVTRNDTLIILGDIGDIECVRQLKGYKVLIKGNHDAGNSIYEEVFDEVYGGPLTISDKIILSHEPIEEEFWMNIHGHIHDDYWSDSNHHLCISAERTGYFPINLGTLIKNGLTANIDTIHRITIDEATARKSH